MMQVQDVIRAAFDSEEFQRLRGIATDATTRRIKAPVEQVLDRAVERFNLREKDGWAAPGARRGRGPDSMEPGQCPDEPCQFRGGL